MKRFLIVLLALVALVIVVPPLWYTLFPVEPSPPLPEPGQRIVLPSGVGLNVLREGAGPPVVLVHGLPGTAYDWRNLTAELAQRGRSVFAIDRSGYGHSDPNPDGDYGVPRNADEVMALIEVLDLDHVTLVGWSYGGVTSSILAMRKPERIDRIVLVGTGGPSSDADLESGPPEPPGFMKFLYSDSVLAWRSRVPPISRGLIDASSAQAFSEGPMPDWWLPSVYANFSNPETVQTYKGEMFNIAPAEEVQPFDYGAIELPTLVLHGDDDRLAGIEVGRYAAEKIPGAELIEIPGGSHMIPVTHAKALAEHIIAFSAPRDAVPQSALEASGEAAAP